MSLKPAPLRFIPTGGQFTMSDSEPYTVIDDNVGVQSLVECPNRTRKWMGALILVTPVATPLHVAESKLERITEILALSESHRYVDAGRQLHMEIQEVVSG